MMKSVKNCVLLLASEILKEDNTIIKIAWFPCVDEIRMIIISSSVDDRLGDLLHAIRFAEDRPDIPYQCVQILMSLSDWDKAKVDRSLLSIDFKNEYIYIYDDFM